MGWRRHLTQFYVVSADELGRALRLPVQARIASELRFAVTLEEDDFGAGSYRLGVIVAQAYGQRSVKNLPDALRDFDKGCKIVICEDGLWTGVELQKVLTRIAKGGDLEAVARDRRFLLRYCAVSDYGILVCRNLLRHLGLDSCVDLSFSDDQRLVQVLAKETQERAKERMHLSPETFREWLDGHVRPMAFQDLPVFWLGGPVTIRGKTIEWLPLVHDERRLEG